MSKHWRLPSTGRRRRRTGALAASEVRLALLGGVLAGLVYVLVPWKATDMAVAAGQRANPATVRVIDGDTFHYQGEKIRIADIDTPEVNGRCAYEVQLAARATRRMDQLLRQGPFTLQPIGRDEDRYGRKLRVVTRGGRSLGDQLVAEGLARTWTGRREPWCA